LHVARPPPGLKRLFPVARAVVGLTGDAAEIREAARAYRVYYEKVERADKSDYTLDHSAFIYLMDRGSKYLGFFPPGTSAERLAEALRLRLAADR